MPWKETCPMDQRLKLISAWKSAEYSMTQLCCELGISRKTGYKWIERYETEGARGLEERTRAPHSHPNALAAEMAARLLAAKHVHPHWGPRKIRDWLLDQEAEAAWPAASTIGELYQRHGLVRARRRRARAAPMSAPLSHCAAANDVWSADFKGQFRLGSGQWCYPLTLSDNASRYLLACRGLSAPTEEAVWPWFERAFREYGLPSALRTDNGVPFASTAIGGLTRLGIWWLKLGIALERIRPGHPEQNGRHERMHRTLKQETAQPAKANLQAQQRAFNRFVEEYNQERPHEALQGGTPAAHYHGSQRPYPASIPEVQYDDRQFIVRRVRSSGEIKWRGQMPYLSEALRGEPVGLKPIDEGRWQVHFSGYVLGMLDERLGRIQRPG